MKPEWKVDWPNLGPHNAFITSAETPDYNCLAFGAGKSDEWWEPYVIPPDNPTVYWPSHVHPENRPEDWAAALATVGFTACGNHDLEPDFVKVAIYADTAGNATHVARQLSDGRWTSKLGSFEDIVHDNLQALEGGLYGRVVVCLRRSRREGDP